MSVLGAFATVFYALWVWLGCIRTPADQRRSLLLNALGTLTVPVLLFLYTVHEMRLWAHLSFPPALLGWVALVFVAFVVGNSSFMARRPALGWPLVGLSVTPLLSILATYVLSRLTGKPIF